MLCQPTTRGLFLDSRVRSWKQRARLYGLLDCTPAVGSTSPAPPSLASSSSQQLPAAAAVLLLASTSSSASGSQAPAPPVAAAAPVLEVTPAASWGLLGPLDGGSGTVQSSSAAAAASSSGRARSVGPAAANAIADAAGALLGSSIDVAGGGGTELPPQSLLEQLIQTRAPVIMSSSPLPTGRGSTFADPASAATAVLVPLMGSGHKVMGALWITRPAGGGSLGGGAPPAGATSNPALLERPAALQQLGLCVSALLLASAQDCQHMAAVSEGLHALASAASVQQLLAALGGAVERHVRQRYLLAPRVVTALVPERGAETGLFLEGSTAEAPSAADVPLHLPSSLPATAGARVASVTGGATHQRATTGPVKWLSRAGSGPINLHTAAAVSSSNGGPPSSNNSNLFLAPATQQATAPPTAVAPKAQASRLLSARNIPAALAMGRPSSEAVNSYLAPGFPNGLRALTLASSSAAPLWCHVSPGGPQDPSAQAAEDSGGRSAARARLLVPLSPQSPAVRQQSASAAAPALHAKPFTLAQTLLKQLLTSASEPGAAASEGESGGRASAASPGGLRPQALAVEDGVALLQDPKQPSRDILLLLAGAGQQARAKIGSSSATALGRSVADNAGVTSEGSLGASGGALAVRSLLLLTLPAGPGSGGAALGLYVIFPQRLPMALLAEARASLLELAEMVAPTVLRKLSQDLALELTALTIAGPGSYAVTSVPAADVTRPCSSGPTLGLHGGRASLKSGLATPTGVRVSVVAAAAGSSHRRLSQLTQQEGCNSPHGPAMPPALLLTTGESLTPVAEGAAAGCGGCDMWSVGGAEEPSLLFDTAPSFLAAGPARAPSMILHMAELKPAASTLRSQLPFLVASLQSSISNARAEASVAAAAAAAAAAASLSTASDAGVTAGNGWSALSTGQCDSKASNNDLARIELVSKIGAGGCAFVFKACMGPLDVAVKADRTSNVSDDVVYYGGAAPSERQVERIQLDARRALLRNAMEVAAMTSLSGHPNVMALYEAHRNVVLMRKDLPDGSARLRLQNASETTESNIPGGSPLCVALVCEWCDRGCLASTLGDNVRGQSRAAAGARPVLNLKFILMTLMDVAMALRHLHSHNLIHRDLKPANVLLSSSHTDPRGFVAKLADFGFVSILDQPGDVESGSQPWALVDQLCGTVTHMPPEALNKPARLGASSDLFSFGVLMWELTAFGSRPYPEVDVSKIAAHVKRGGRPVFKSNVPSAYRSLAAQCWNADPLKRPKAAALVAAISNMLEGMP
ncbi:hypothetical protein HYH03_005828 [Edaphochlamys debaryana]|uniref:Protein kinase domain-containing protein n=1 Tax=Edaphochlamys debaryana TaxID=47281 RepID=A0A835Y500_9CHLO|nr:hypothetical protein HYH03_005828 [Edaphochlamys debaryana]|eukprot:KAG2496230.1 hypothetical protein HYH03_005828 [Edaphochlamys debaryana]